MPVSNQQLDEFGIPIKKTVSSPELDEFGIPIKKKDGGPALPSSPSLELPSVSTEPPKRLTYTDINSSIEKLSKAQKDLRELESAPGFTPGGYSPNYAKVNNDAIAAANKNVAKAKADRDKIFSEYAGEISRPVEQLIESQDYTKFFTPSGNIDYAKAREHFQKVSQQFGGGPALVEHWVANLKMRGQGEIERKEVKPLFEQKLKELGLQKYADQEQYAKSVFDGVVQKNKNQIDLLIQDRDQRANSLLDKYKDRIDYYTRDMNAVSSALNDFVQSGEMSEQEAKEKYDAQKSFYDERILEVNKEYETEVSKINRQVKQKYGRINQELDAISKDKDFVMKSIPEADRKLIDKAYIDARAQRMKGKENVDRAVDEASGLSGLFARSVSSGFLSGIASIGDAMSSGGYSNKLVDWMQNKRTAAEELKPAEYTWSGDPLKRAITSSGQSLGASAPLLAPSIGLMAATGGSAAGVVGSALLSYYGENKQNAGQVYRDVLEQSGDVALARDQARDYFQKTAVTLPLYFVGSLGEKALVLGKGLKKAAAGLGLELAEEIPVEYIQSHAEAVTSQGYKGSLAQYIKENPELMLDIAVGTGVQAGAMKTVAAAFSKVASAAPAPQTQTLADAIMTQGREFAVRLVQTQFDQGLINEQKRDELFQSIGTIEANLAKLDELGVRGDAAKLHMALSQEMAELQANRKAEKDESVQAVLDSKINDLKTQMTGVLTGQTEYIVFGMPGDVNSKTMLASQYNALSQQEKDDTIRSAKSVTVINNPQLNQQLQDQKQALGNPEGAPEGAYETNATVQSQVEQQAGPAEGGVQERPGVDGGQQEVGQEAGQQGQAPVTQPDTGDRVLGGQAEVDLAGELRGELRQDFQPIIDRAAKSLQAANVQFEVLDDAEFTSRAGQSAEGAFMTVGNDGKILLNRQKMEQADPGVIIWHESAHPVMNIVRNTNKPLYDRMVTGLKQLAQKSPELQRAIEFGKQYGVKLREAGRGDAEAIALEDDESIVESIAMIAADDKLMASLPTSIKQTLIDFVNYIAKALGIKARVTNTASADFRRTAQQIATALKEGRDITEIVGAENVGIIRPATQDIQLRSIEEMIANDVESKVISGVKASTRIPSAKGAPSDTHTSNKYIVDLKSQRESPSNYISNAIEISGYPIVSGLKESEIKVLNDGLLPKSKGGTQDQVDAAMKVADRVYKNFIRSVADNLIWLHNHFNENLRLISRRWYDGANKIAQDYTSKYGVTLEQASGVIAVLSPQMDWYKNVSLADRVLDIVKNKSKFVFDQNMADTYVRISANIQQFKNESDADFNKRLDSTVASAREEAKGLVGKALDSDPLMFPKTLRVYDETYNDKSYDILSPNAEPIGKATKKDGSFSSIGWQGYSTIAKAISIVNDGSAKNISIQLGEMHKVRNFYNNIADPNSENGDVTIDTHAVAAGLLKPLAGSDLEVIANLSGKGSAITGSTGTYPAFADAYRLAAKEVGIQPRQMQSITWEAVRGLFKDTWKTSKNKALVNQIWKDYADGKNSIDETRKRIDEIAGGVEKPSWARSGSEAVAETGAAADSGQLPSGGNMGVQRASGAGTTTEREAGMVQPTTQLSIGNRQAIIDKAKADGTYLKAPNGQPTNLSEDQWTTVRTPEFKNWFGDWENDPANASKVVDDNGEPMVVYHGSENKFDEFRINPGSKSKSRMQLLFGSHFATDKSDASIYAGDDGKIYNTYLSIKNPINLSVGYVSKSDSNFSAYVELAQSLGFPKKFKNVFDYDLFTESGDYGGKSSEVERVFITQFMLDSIAPSKAMGALVDAGFDGVAYTPFQPVGTNAAKNFSESFIAFSPNQIKSATSNVGTFSTEDARIQFSIGGRQPVGRISWERSMEGKGDPSISSRNPVVTKAAQDLKDGKITNEEYRATVSENSPIRPITRFFEPATEQQVKASLSVDKSDKANAPLTDGTVVGLRLDIPAYQNKNTWVVSVHEGNTNSGKPISYRNVAMIRNVKFGSTPKGVLNIATGKEKQTIGRMFGEWVNIPGQTMEQQGESAKRMVQDIVDNPEYVQVGMNPFRHSYFYDRNTDIGRPIVSADEAIQVGGLVYAKNPVYGNWTDESYAVKGLFDAAGKQVQFSIGNRDSIVRSLSMVDPAIKQDLKKMSEPSAVTADDLAMFFRMPDGTYSDGNDDYDSWDDLRQVGEDNDLRLRQSTPEEIRSKRYEDKYVLDNILEEKENEILQKQFDSKMEVWNFFNDEGLNRLGYNSPMEMSDVDRQIHAALVKKGVEEFERQELSTLADAYEIIGNSVDESIADAYLKAKADGTNQEFVRQVDAAIESRQLSAGPRAESRVEFKLVAFVLRKKAEGHTDQQIASAIRSVMPGMTQQQVDNLVSNPEDFLFRAFPGISPMQFQNLLRRAQVKNIYRGNMPQNIAERFLSSMVPNEVLEKYYMQVKTKAQVRKDAINQFLTKNFDPAKGLPKWVMLLKEYSSGAKNLEIARAKSTLDRLAKTAREIGFTDWKTFSDALRNLNEEEAIMSGSTELTLFDPATGMAMVPSSGERLQRPLTLLRLPLEIQPYVREMRNQIDGLTKKLITGGFVTPEQAVTLEMNLGEYTNRAYELYTKKGFQPKKEAFDAAVRFLADQEYRRLLTEYINNLSVAVRGQIGVMTGAGPIVAESGTGIPYAKLAEEAAQYAERRANDIINKKETPYFGGSGPTSRGLGILKQRQTIPQPIRALMGEYTDPGVVFMMTVAKQAELAATSDYLRQLRDQGLGTLFFEKNDQNRPATHSVPLASDTSATMEPLNGLYTTPEIAEAFEDAVNTRNAFMQIWMKIVGANRWFKTVGSIRTQFVNFESNLGFAVLNGLIFTKDGRPTWRSKSITEAREYAKGQYGPKEISEITEKAIKLGLVGQNIDINAVRKAFREDDMFEMALDVALTSEGVFKKKNISRKKPKAFFDKLYRMGDDFWKIYGYITERETVANGRYDSKYDQLTDEQKEAVDKEAADRVKDTWPTYDRMFEAVRKLSQNVPILGNFTAFQAESIRVLMNSIRLMKKDLADPQMRQAGVRRRLGIITYFGLRTGITTMSAMSMGYGVSGVLGLLLNDDDEEDKKWAIKEVSPIFMRSGDLFIKQDKDKPHIYTVVDFLSIDPIGITQRSMNALTEGNEDMDAGVGAAVAELFGGFLGREMTFKAAEDLVRNRNSSNGLKIYNEEDTPGEAVGKITKHLYKSLKPSTVGLVERALTNENKAFEAAAFVGFRPYEIDLHQSFNISLTRMRNSIDEISAEYTKIKFDPKISEEDKEQARLRAGEKKAEVIKKYNRLYTTLIKLGASQEVLEEMVDEKKAVKPTGMDKKTKAGILEGGVDPTTLY